MRRLPEPDNVAFPSPDTAPRGSLPSKSPARTGAASRRPADRRAAVSAPTRAVSLALPYRTRVFNRRAARSPQGVQPWT